MTPPFRYQTVTKASKRLTPEWGSLRPSFLLSLALADPEQSAKGLQMINAIYTRENEWNKGEFLKEEQEFENIGQLEHFLAYNRSYITNLTFEGSINTEEETEEAFDYEGTIRFTTDKELTNEQLAQLIDLITLQIVEPVNEEQEDEDYSTRNAEVTIKEVQ